MEMGFTDWARDLHRLWTRQGQEERAPIPRLALDPRLATMNQGYVLDDGETETGPSSGTATPRVDPIEPLEEPWKMIHRYAGSEVDNRQFDFSLAL